MDDSLWARICDNLQTRLPSHVYHSLVETADFELDEKGSFNLRFGDHFSKESFEEKCLSTLKETLAEFSLGTKNINLLVKESGTANPQIEFNVRSINPFDSKYTFETYVTGSNNQFAHAACFAVSNKPGHCYNPLFIFGGAGLGKTHLLKAIGHEIFLRQSHLKILFLTSESFTNELIQALRVDRMREFREKYRNRCDVLLLDDVHFLAGKERTQEEFFYTFNYLHEAGKQIVVTSDRYPKDIQGLENRLQTRFEWGLVADVQPPEIETRIAILKNKAETENIRLPDDVAHFIASHITTNIRELEGSLHRLQAYASLTGVPISVDLCQMILKDIIPKTKHSLSADGILKIVALNFSLKVTDLKSEKRTRKMTIPRQICMYLMRKHLLLSYPEIGKLMGGKDHTTVMHAVSKIAEIQRTDPEIFDNINKIETLFR